MMPPAFAYITRAKCMYFKIIIYMSSFRCSVTLYLCSTKNSFKIVFQRSQSPGKIVLTIRLTTLNCLTVQKRFSFIVIVYLFIQWVSPQQGVSNQACQSSILSRSLSAPVASRWPEEKIRYFVFLHIYLSPIE